MKSIVILISGRGSNLRALLDAGPPEFSCAVISNRPDAEGLAYARERNVATAVVDHCDYSSRTDFDAALAEAIDRYQPDLVVLAGFMRILGDAFVRRYQGRLLNIHPSLLPAFPGLRTHAQALAAGVKIHGCTVHFVTPALDCGPIVIQAAVPVLGDDTAEILAARVLEQEHRIYPQALRWFLAGRLTLTADGRVLLDGETPSDASLVAPLAQ
ncbi:MAG: phosphoribosylglycinamide formyltransferase [Betaproteobacteria bacterium]|nr:phosphoribosylglycinamide formyltransferase [Betaproteobacteria bacterium]